MRRSGPWLMIIGLVRIECSASASVPEKRRGKDPREEDGLVERIWLVQFSAFFICVLQVQVEYNLSELSWI